VPLNVEAEVVGHLGLVGVVNRYASTGRIADGRVADVLTGDRSGVVITDDDGTVTIASPDAEACVKAIKMVRELTQEAEIGKLYLGIVKKVVDFGAFVEIFPGTDGLIHISHIANERINKVTDVLSEGDEVLVRVIDVDRSGKVRLSRKEALDAALDF